MSNILTPLAKSPHQSINDIPNGNHVHNVPNIQSNIRCLFRHGHTTQAPVLAFTFIVKVIIIHQKQSQDKVYCKIKNDNSDRDQYSLPSIQIARTFVTSSSMQN